MSVIGSARKLWCCERCEMIGPIQAALAHTQGRGHPCRKLTDAQAAAVRAIWHEEDRCWDCGSERHYAEGCPLQ